MLEVVGNPSVLHIHALALVLCLTWGSVLRQAQLWIGFSCIRHDDISFPAMSSSRLEIPDLVASTTSVQSTQVEFSSSATLGDVRHLLLGPCYVIEYIQGSSTMVYLSYNRASVFSSRILSIISSLRMALHPRSHPLWPEKNEVLVRSNLTPMV